jgi:hypothetical protein
MTDALAKWFLEQVEVCGQPWQDLDRLLQAPVPQAAFEEWVTTLRDAGRLRNDDVTMMLIDRVG